MIAEQESVYKEIISDFNNTSPNNSCPIVSYKLMPVENDTTYEQFVRLNKTGVRI
jgi:hypothetical protein